jgi:hypothetical protein
MKPEMLFFKALQDFAESIKGKFSARSSGDPEDQLKPPVDRLFAAFAEITSQTVVLKGETRLAERLGRPDFAAEVGGLLVGYIELKAPGKGADPHTFRGHDREQWERFRNVPNVIYTDGNEWALFRSGEAVGARIVFGGTIESDGKAAISDPHARALFRLIADFASWKPIVPKRPRELAAFLAPFCRMLRDEVLDALAAKSASMHALKSEIKALLFPDANDHQFSDAYAQTVMFALLLAQMEGADVLELSNAYERLESHHALLSRSLQFLTTDHSIREEIDVSLGMVQRVINEIPPSVLKAPSAAKDPWLFFYEDFLAEYDPAFRKQAGVYFTPLEVVHCQVRLIDEILREHLGSPMGFVEPAVATLDPAVGTGTYLLAIIEHALRRVAETEGAGAVRGGARSLVHNLHGFELMVGPYAVAQLRVSIALSKHGISLPATGPGIYLTNTLESPHTRPPVPPLFHQPIAQEHQRALRVKESEHILVCLGNPPYGRHEARTSENTALTGGWVRYGDKGHFIEPILEDFLEPARKAGYGVHLKNLYNLYVYFIRWALWKVFEHKTASGPGIVSFITASSYIDGDAFAGLREHLRRICERIDIIDLGGEGRGTRKDENVFAIQTPVAIMVAWRKTKTKGNTPAVVRYARIEGTREAKLSALESVESAGDLRWSTAADGWQAPFRPVVKSAFGTWPDVADLLPWQNNGVKAGRTWVIAPSRELLERRLTKLFAADKHSRSALFKESPTGRKFADETRQLPPALVEMPALKDVRSGADMQIQRYGFRSFNREYIIADSRFLDRPGPGLWEAHGDRQLYLTSLFNHPLGEGPALTASAEIPDLHHFRGSFGAKEVLPLYRDRRGTQPNVAPGLLEAVAGALRCPVTFEDLVAYIYAALAHPAYTSEFSKELENRCVRVPITTDGKLFGKVAKLGRELLWLHTYSERFSDAAHPKGAIPHGRARCTTAVGDEPSEYPEAYEYEPSSGRLSVGSGVFSPVSQEVFGYSVSGFAVVEAWLTRRLKDASGKRSSELDAMRPTTWPRAFTTELLELLWVLERTVALQEKQRELLVAILAGPLLTATELPPVPDAAREPPSPGKTPAGQMRLGM